MEHHVSVLGVLVTILVLCQQGCHGFFHNYRPHKPGVTPMCKGVSSGITEVKLPDALPLRILDKYVEGKRLSEVYYGLPPPPAFIPFTSFKCMLNKVRPEPGTFFPDGQYRFAEEGPTYGDPPTCFRVNVKLEVVPGYHTARFIRTLSTGKELLDVFWSSCPSKYVLILRCDAENITAIQTCPLENTNLILYVVGETIDDLPMADIVKDMAQTGVQFGDPAFKWFFTFGDNTLPCDQ